jgi:hypothetical protein
MLLASQETLAAAEHRAASPISSSDTGDPLGSLWSLPGTAWGALRRLNLQGGETIAIFVSTFSKPHTSHRLAMIRF